MWSGTGGHSRLKITERSKKRWMVNTYRGKKQLKRQTLEFGTKDKGQNKPSETNGLYAPEDSQTSNLSQILILFNKT